MKKNLKMLQMMKQKTQTKNSSAHDQSRDFPAFSFSLPGALKQPDGFFYFLFIHIGVAQQDNRLLRCAGAVYIVLGKSVYFHSFFGGKTDQSTLRPSVPEMDQQVDAGIFPGCGYLRGDSGDGCG